LDTWRKPNFQLNLRLIAPRIAAMEDSELTVPGQFDAKKYRHEQEFINRFEPMIDVLNTKQLPRKLTIHGKSSQWTFLLKGNEDLRQDERIMQLIVLTNSLLNHNNDAYTRQLFLQPYSKSTGYRF
jgi:FKBP12-rapamycin complex-associated protein